MKARLPAAGYRMLALLALRHHGELTKGRLAFEIRANHTMATKVLAELVADGLATVTRRADGANLVRSAPDLAERALAEAGTLAHLFRDALVDHYRFGVPPPWTHRPPWRDADGRPEP